VPSCEECFVYGIARAFSFFGGVVATLVPDNLKAGVIPHTKRVIRLSRAIVELASYYRLWVDPTRVHRPRDKAKVEERVRAVQNWVLAPLRDEHFTSLAELNEAIARVKLLSGGHEPNTRHAYVDSFGNSQDFSLPCILPYSATR